jgi:hypothetical protein
LYKTPRKTKKANEHTTTQWNNNSLEGKENNLKTVNSMSCTPRCILPSLSQRKKNSQAVLDVSNDFNNWSPRDR